MKKVCTLTDSKATRQNDLSGQVVGHASRRADNSPNDYSIQFFSKDRKVICFPQMVMNDLMKNILQFLSFEELLKLRRTSFAFYSYIDKLNRLIFSFFICSELNDFFNTSLSQEIKIKLNLVVNDCFRYPEWIEFLKKCNECNEFDLNRVECINDIVDSQLGINSMFDEMAIRLIKYFPKFPKIRIINFYNCCPTLLEIILKTITHFYFESINPRSSFTIKSLPSTFNTLHIGTLRGASTFKIEEILSENLTICIYEICSQASLVLPEKLPANLKIFIKKKCDDVKLSESICDVIKSSGDWDGNWSSFLLKR